MDQTQPPPSTKTARPDPGDPGELVEEPTTPMPKRTTSNERRYSYSRLELDAAVAEALRRVRREAPKHDQHGGGACIEDAVNDVAAYLGIVL